MEVFNPVDQRRLLDGKTGYARLLNRAFEEARDAGGLASSADFHLNKAIRCLLVGYDEPAEALLARAQEWVTIAIRDDERPSYDFRGGTEGSRHLTLALCNWLLTGEHDSENYARFTEHYDPFLVREKHVRDKMEIGLTLPYYDPIGSHGDDITSVNTKTHYARRRKLIDR